MSYKGRSLDPRQMTSRFAGTCYTCKKPIKKGEEIIYWPNGNHAEHFACGEADYRHSLASFEDEENYNNQYPSWWLIAVPVPKCRNRDCFFCSYFIGKTLFLCYCTGKETAWQKENRMKTGNFLKEKVPKTPRTLLKIYSKGKFMKIFLAKCDSRCGHPRCLSPVGIIQIFEGKNLTWSLA